MTLKRMRYKAKRILQAMQIRMLVKTRPKITTAMWKINMIHQRWKARPTTMIRIVGHVLCIGSVLKYWQCPRLSGDRHSCHSGGSPPSDEPQETSPHLTSMGIYMSGAPTCRRTATCRALKKGECAPRSFCTLRLWPQPPYWGLRP